MNFRDYDADALRAVSRKAGQSSGKARREKREAIEREKRAEIARRELFHQEVTALRREARALLQMKREMDRQQIMRERTGC